MLMKRNLRVIFSWCFVFMLVLTSAACAGKELSAKEIMAKAIEAQADLNSYRFSLELNAELDLPEQSMDEFDVGVSEFFEHFSLQVEGIHQQDPLQTEMTIQLNLGDMSFDIPIVLTEEKMWLKLPDTSAFGFSLPEEMTEKYIELSMNELEEMGGLSPYPVSSNSADVDQITKLGQEMLEIFATHYDGTEFISVTDAKTAQLPQNIDAKHVIKLSINNENLENAVQILIQQVLPDLLDLISQDEWADVFQLNQSDLDTLKQEIDTMKQELEENQQKLNDAIEELKEFLNIHEFKITTAVNEKYYTTYQEISIDTDVINEGESGRVAIQIVMTMDDINENPAFEIGIPDQNESIPFTEMLQMFMFGF